MINEILKVLEIKPEDAVHTKQKKIPLLLAQLKTYVNSPELNSNTSPVNSFNWDELKIDDEARKSPNITRM